MQNLNPTMYNGELRCESVPEAILTGRYNHNINAIWGEEELFYCNKRQEIKKEWQPTGYWEDSMNVLTPRSVFQPVSSSAGFNISRNIHLSYEEIPSEKFLRCFDETAWPETPPSVYEEGFFSKIHFVEEFFGYACCSQMIIRAVIVKVIGRKKTTQWAPQFKSIESFIPQILLMGYILLSRLVECTIFESPFDIPEIYLVCCIAASKTQYDSHISNVDFSDEIGIHKINYLEGLVLNRLEYEVKIRDDEICRAVEEINRLGWMEPS